MLPLLSQVSGDGGALLSSSHHSSLKFVDPIPSLFSKHYHNFSISRRLKLVNLTNAAESSGCGTTTKSTSYANNHTDDEIPNSISSSGQGNVPSEGVTQFGRPSSSRLANLSFITILAGGDVVALLLFAAIGRLSHGFSVFHYETFRAADPFIAGWLLSAYFLGGYSEDGRGIKGGFNAVITSVKSWAMGIPLGLIICAFTIGHAPPTKFISVTMSSTATLILGWRSLFYSIFLPYNTKNDHTHKHDSSLHFLRCICHFNPRFHAVTCEVHGVF